MNSNAKSNMAWSGNCVSQGAMTTVTACSCGGAGCAVCDGQGYVRPNFFSGQLLTDDDLQSLSAYVAAKNRLHNRHFFGEGVVCGLVVTCHPCGGGKVIVAPGYALDCCGNDIVLACPTELDINAMVRELRVQMLGGFDCGDPCADKKQTGAGATGKKDCVEDKQPSRRYCLYIRYCEQPTDLVTPYGTDEPCVNPACEPTRIREGVKFELRCPQDEETPDDLFVHWRRCFGDPLGAKTGFIEAPWHWTYACQIAIATENIPKQAIPPFGEADIPTLGTATTNLNTKVIQFSGVLGTAVTSETAPARPEITKRQALQEVLEATLAATSLVARFLSISNEDQAGLLHNGVLKPVLTDLNTTFRGISDIVFQQQIDRIPLNTLDRAYAKALFAVGSDVVREAASLSTQDSQNIGTTRPSPPDPAAVLFLAYGVPLSPDLLRTAGQRASALRDWLLCQLDNTACSTDCTLRDEVLCINLSGWNPNALANAGTAYSTATLKLLEALFRYLQECLCCALNPPCPPCEDTAVLLACLEVKDCKVVKICDLERTFVLTPLALRYWLPPLRLLGEVIEKLCCMPIHLKCGTFEQGHTPRTSDTSPGVFRRVPPAILSKLFGLANPSDTESLAVTLGALWNLIRTESVTSAFPMRNLLATSEPGGKAITALTEGIRPILAQLQGLASLLGAETSVGRLEWESLKNDYVALQQKVSDLEARIPEKPSTTNKKIKAP